MTTPLNARISVRVTADLDVRLFASSDEGRCPPAALTLTPDEAAIVARWLTEAAETAVNESRARRRQPIEPDEAAPHAELLDVLAGNRNRCRSWTHDEGVTRYRCQLREGHHPGSLHRHAGMTWA